MPSHVSSQGACRSRIVSGCPTTWVRWRVARVLACNDREWWGGNAPAGDNGAGVQISRAQCSLRGAAACLTFGVAVAPVVVVVWEGHHLAVERLVDLGAEVGAVALGRFGPGRTQRPEAAKPQQPTAGHHRERTAITSLSDEPRCATYLQQKVWVKRRAELVTKRCIRAASPEGSSPPSPLGFGESPPAERLAGWRAERRHRAGYPR